MLGGVRSVLSLPLWTPSPRRQPTPPPSLPLPPPRAVSRSHLPLPLSLLLALFLSLPATLSGDLSPLFLSFFSRGGSLFFLRPTALLPRCLPPLASPRPFRHRLPRGLPLSSPLMPRDRQMMIKKAPVRVRTTPRRARVPPLAPHAARAFSATSSSSAVSTFSISGDSSSSFPLLPFLLFSSLGTAPLFFSVRLSSLSSPSPPPARPSARPRALSLFFRRLISARSLSLSLSRRLSPFRLLAAGTFFSPLREPFLLAVTRLSRASWSAENALFAICY